MNFCWVMPGAENRTPWRHQRLRCRAVPAIVIDASHSIASNLVTDSMGWAAGIDPISWPDFLVMSAAETDTVALMLHQFSSPTCSTTCDLTTMHLDHLSSMFSFPNDCPSMPLCSDPFLCQRCSSQSFVEWLLLAGPTDSWDNSLCICSNNETGLIPKTL